MAFEENTLLLAPTDSRLVAIELGDTWTVKFTGAKMEAATPTRAVPTPFVWATLMLLISISMPKSSRRLRMLAR